MNWEKVKTFLIILFFGINVFLVGFMLNSVKITSSASKTVIDDTVAILTANSINITNEQIPYSITNPGTFDAMPINVAHSYTSPKELNEDNIEGELKKAMAVVDLKKFDITKIDGSTYSIRQIIDDHHLCDSAITAKVENNHISLNGIWYKPKSKPRKGGDADNELVYVTGVLIDFINNPDRDPAVNHTVSSIEVGYGVPQYDGGVQHASVPVVACYSINTSDGSSFIYEASSGEYLRKR